MKWSKTAMSESFYMSNVTPQRPGFNRGIWRRLEEQVRTWATKYEEIYIVTGPILEENLPTIGSNKVAVPNYYYKVILDYKKPQLKGIGFVLPHREASEKPLQSYVISIDSVETLTGIDFFPAIPDSLEEIIEATIQLNRWFSYSSSSSTTTSAIMETEVSDSYCASAKSKVFHYCSCRHAKKIASGNLITFRTRDKAIQSGRRPCKACEP
jgi:endonuclease G